METNLKRKSEDHKVEPKAKHLDLKERNSNFFNPKFINHS
jgi:hypothetical protein